MVGNMGRLDVKVLRNDLPGYPGALSIIDKLPRLAGLDKRIVAGRGAEVSFLTAYASPGTHQNITTTGATNLDWFIITGDTRSLDQAVNVLPTNTIPFSEFNHWGEQDIPIDDVNLILSAEFSHSRSSLIRCFRLHYARKGVNIKRRHNGYYQMSNHKGVADLPAQRRGGGPPKSIWVSVITPLRKSARI
jgi:hypothetical protein